MTWSTFRNVLQLTLALAAGHAAAQNPNPGCQIPSFSGASSPRGTVATMTVVNDGNSCGTSLYGIPAERRNPATQGAITAEPKHGKAEFVESRVQYTPAAGYVGDDEFSFEAWAVGTSNRPVQLKVQMKVLVRAPQ